MRLPAGRIKAGQLITPLAFLAVTAAIVIMPAERSGWDIRDSVIPFLAFFATFVAIFAIISLGLNVQWGYTGIFNFGVMAFFLVGANTAAIITKPPASGEFVRYVGGFGNKLDFIPWLDSGQWLPFLFGIAGAALFSGVLAFLLSIPALRLREDYLAIATIGIAELLRRVTIEERGLVNGTRGLPGIPRPLGNLVEPDEYKFVIFGIAVVVLIIVYIALERGIRSPWGRVLRALREDELATAASGKNVFAFKSQGFVLGAMIIGTGGAIYAYANSSISPDTFTHFFGTFIFWAMLMVGGSGNNKGAILGAYIVWGLWTTTLQIQGYDIPTALSSRIFFIRDFVLGALIVIVLLLRPQGLMPEERRVSIWVERHTRRRRGQERAPPKQAELPSD
ncbi:MAG: branched-chain amino acid ABC transporter permease [Chloroflexi bacterium]|nr:branched-chain amino acid ABC transporter permease [Chloroflexota bacterium]